MDSKNKLKNLISISYFVKKSSFIFSLRYVSKVLVINDLLSMNGQELQAVFCFSVSERAWKMSRGKIVDYKGILDTRIIALFAKH